METCFFCQKGILEDKKVTVDFRWGGELTVIEDVPAKVCNECGERYYSAEVSREMEKIATKEKKEKIIEVPLARLSEKKSAVVFSLSLSKLNLNGSINCEDGWSFFVPPSDNT